MQKLIEFKLYRYLHNHNYNSITVDQFQNYTLSYIHNPFFPWMLLVLYLNRNNLKRPVIYLLIAFWFLISNGELLGRTLDVLQTNHIKYWPYSLKNWYVGCAGSYTFRLVGEIIADWYPLLRTKAITKKKNIKIVYITCILFNISKVFCISCYYIFAPKTLNKKILRNGMPENDRYFYKNFYVIWLNSVFVMLITSIIYDLSVTYYLRTYLFNKLKRYSDNNFIEKFKKISEYRIIFSLIASFIFLPVVIYYIISNIKDLNSANEYVHNRKIENMRVMVVNINYYFMYIDQILLRFFADNNEIFKLTLPRGTSSPSKSHIDLNIYSVSSPQISQYSQPSLSQITLTPQSPKASYKKRDHTNPDNSLYSIISQYSQPSFNSQITLTPQSPRISNKKHKHSNSQNSFYSIHSQYSPSFNSKPLSQITLTPRSPHSTYKIHKNSNSQNSLPSIHSPSSQNSFNSPNFSHSILMPSSPPKKYTHSSTYHSQHSCSSKNNKKSKKSDNTQIQKNTKKSDNTQNTKNTKKSDNTQNPKNTKKSDNTQNPKNTKKSDNTQNPKNSKKSDNIQSQKISKNCDNSIVSIDSQELSHITLTSPTPNIQLSPIPSTSNIIIIKEDTGKSLKSDLHYIKKFYKTFK